MEELTKEVKEKAKEYGADLVGVGGIDRFEAAPEHFHPEKYLEGAKSVISIAAHFPYSIVDSWENSPFSYLYYGYQLINKELGRASFYVAKFLEKKGYQTYPVVPTVYMQNYDYEELEGIFSHLHAAYAGGLGEFGYSNCFITPEYGTKVRFCSIITEAELEQDEIYNGEPLCDRCMKCVEICPTNAIKKETRTCTVAGKEIEYAKFDRVGCYYSILGLAPGTGGIANIEPPEKESFSTWDITLGRLKALLKRRQQYLWQVASQFVVDWGDFCGRCLHVCDRPVEKEK